MSKEFIFRIDGVLYNEKTGKLCVHPEVQGELTRCGDCKHWHDAPTSDGCNSCEKDALIRHEDFFCAAAERKEGEA